uniref:Uncharacterized protein n=1 Tax=Anguilla anguilla TaxID=7936 RepID=A0A0E9XZM1_ANGAN
MVSGRLFALGVGFSALTDLQSLLCCLQFSHDS